MGAGSAGKKQIGFGGFVFRRGGYYPPVPQKFYLFWKNLCKIYLHYLHPRTAKPVKITV